MTDRKVISMTVFFCLTAELIPPSCVVALILGGIIYQTSQNLIVIDIELDDRQKLFSMQYVKIIYEKSTFIDFSHFFCKKKSRF